MQIVRDILICCLVSDLYVCDCPAGSFSSDDLQSNRSTEKHFVKAKIKHFFARFMYASVISGEKLWLALALPDADNELLFEHSTDECGL